MKKIGLLGGTSWPSTIPYYEWFNRAVIEREGGYHSARLVLHSLDYHPVKSRYTQEGGWDEIPTLLLAELEELNKAEPDCIVICNNTLHKAVDILEAQGALNHLPPIVHIVDGVAREAKEAQFENLLLLGTKFTMEDGFYAKRLSEKFGLSTSIPCLEDRDRIQAMQSEIAAGRMREEFKGEFKNLLARCEDDFDAVILACTELPLAVSDDCTSLPIIDPIEAQCEAALNLAFET